MWYQVHVGGVVELQDFLQEQQGAISCLQRKSHSGGHGGRWASPAGDPFPLKHLHP